MNLGELERILEHIDKMPIAIAENITYWANGDHTYSKNTIGFIKELKQWRDELIDLIMPEVESIAY